MTEPLPVLTLSDLSVSFRTPVGEEAVVSGVSIEVFPGQTVAIVGESGSGKSTTAAAIIRLLPAGGRITSGRVLFRGRDLLALTEREMRAVRGADIGFVPQDPMSHLNPLMRVGEQISEALAVHGQAVGGKARARAVELLDWVGVPDAGRRARQYPHQLSGGMQQRVLIAMGLACQPTLLIADEPTSALDVTVQRRILDRLAAMTKEMGTSVFLITHDLGLAAERADTVAVMRHGQIVEAGEPARILTDPRHDYTRELLCAAPSLRPVTRVRAAPAGEPRASDEVPADLVRVEDLAKTFTIRRAGRLGSERVLAVDRVSFTIARGQTVAIVGESGSGKSTTADLVLGLHPPTAGRITFDGTDVSSMGRRELFALRRRVQPVFQNPYASLDPRYTVERTIAEPLRVHRVGTAASRTREVGRLLDQVALPATMASRLPHELSGGQRQRVAIARALALSPQLLVLDEASSALDVVVQAQILHLLAELQRELGLSYLFISHDLAVVRMIAHTVHVMRAGRFVESGTTTQVFQAPKSPHTRELLDAIPGARLAV